MNKPKIHYFKQSLRESVSIDPELVAFVQKKMAAGAIPTSVIPAEIQHFAAVGNFQPTTRTTLPMALGFVQAPYIGDELLPNFVGGADEQASYPSFGWEQFYATGSAIAMAGDLPEVDINVSWTKVGLDVYGRKAYIDRRERAAAVTLPVGLDAYKMSVIETQVRTQREKAQADFVQATGNYLSGSYYETLSGSTQWSHASGVPITDVVGKREFVRKAARTRPDVLWLSPDALTSMRKNAQVVAAVQYTGTRAQPGNMVPVETLVALFNMTIISGEAGFSATAGGTSAADIYGQNAGLLCTGQNEVMSVRFGMTVSSAGYPNIRTYPEEDRGARGSDAMTYSDAWKIVGIKSSAGYLWTNASAAL